MADERKKEIERHNKRKDEIMSNLKKQFGLMLVTEGLSEALIVLMVPLVHSFVIAVFLPEFAASKIVAVILGIIIGIFAIAAVIIVILTSIHLFKKLAEDYRRDENIEDGRHKSALSALGNN